MCILPRQILEICLRLVTHDPNYNYEDYSEDTSSGGAGGMDMEEEEEDQEDDEYSDDDDMSWKVGGGGHGAIVSGLSQCCLQSGAGTFKII